MRYKYKKIVLLLAMTIFVLSNMLITVMADDEATADTPQQVVYSISYKSCTTVMNDGIYYRGDIGSGTITLSGSKLVGYLSSSGNGVSLYMYGNSNFECSEFLDNLRLHGAILNGETTSGLYNKDTYVFTDQFSNNPIVHSNILTGRLYWTNASSFNDFVIDTNIPIFNSKDEALQYANGDIGIDECLNYEDVMGIVYDLEVPQNMKVTKENGFFEGNLQFTWEQTDPDYKNWTTEVFVYEDFRYRDSFLVFSFADWEYVENYFLFRENVSTYKLKWTYSDSLFDKYDVYEHERTDYPTEYGGVYESQKDYFYIRNYYYDANERINHYSNWVFVEYSYADGEVKTSVLELEGSEPTSSEPPKNNIVDGSQYTGEEYGGYDEVAGNDLIGYISNGFGLTGDNGLLALLKDTLSFVPSDIWTILTATVAMFAVIAIVKFVRG